MPEIMLIKVVFPAPDLPITANNSPGNTTKSLFALGGEYYPLNYLPCRVGFSIGGYDNWAISAGAGLRFKYLIIDFGAEGINNAIANKRLTLAFSTKFLL